MHLVLIGAGGSAGAVARYLVALPEIDELLRDGVITLEPVEVVAGGTPPTA